MPTRWYRERKKEGYYRAAKKEGYRARSAYKLFQIQKKYDIIKKGDCILDLGAAPGGWSQIAVRCGAKVIAVDIDDMKPLEGVQFIKGDITEPITVQRIMEKAKAIDAVISDIAPNITGNYTLDQARSIWLCENTLDVARKTLKKNGKFVCKVFVGEDYQPFLKKVKDDFHNVKAFSPHASRKSSSEIYLIGIGFKGMREAI
jgi:23S rRNA (uridine2552-2'-O)-methyltransferase